jgi:hypothetical protein
MNPSSPSEDYADAKGEPVRPKTISEIAAWFRGLLEAG